MSPAPDRAILDSLPDNALLPVRYIREILARTTVHDSEPLADLDVADVAAALGRAPSTIRAWLHAGELQGGYKLRGREWRVPREALRAYLDAQRQGTDLTAVFRRREVDLSSWRKVRT